VTVPGWPTGGAAESLTWARDQPAAIRAKTAIIDGAKTNVELL
jgi:hypothetical protein